jgi:cell division protein FtsB
LLYVNSFFKLILMFVSAKLKYVILTVLFFVAAINLTRTTLEIFKSSKRLEDLGGEVSELQREKQELEESIGYQGTDAYVEERARNDLNLIKPGDHIFVIDGGIEVDGEISNDVLAEISERINKENDFKDSNIYHWYRLFF